MPERTLDIGCGRNKRPGSIGLDVLPRTDADVRGDINSGRLPFADNSFDRVWLIHVIEHVDDVVRTIEEIHRVSKPGARLHIETPHYTDFSSFCDPTHRWHLNSFSFRYFTEEGGYSYYSTSRLREVRVHVKLLNLWKYLGWQWLVNTSRQFRKNWEYYFCYLVRGKALVFEFEVLK